MADDIGWRTGKPVLNGKVPRRDSDGCELFTDYFTSTESSPTPFPNEAQGGPEEHPLECGVSSFLDEESFVLDSLESSWTQGDNHAGSPVIHPGDISAAENSHLYVIEAMRRHELIGDSDLHSPAHKEGNSTEENITCTKTDIQPIIIAISDSSATSLFDIASEELERRETSANSGAAKSEVQVQRDSPSAFSLAGLRTGEEEPNSLCPPFARSHINENLGRHPVFWTDDDISQIVHCSNTSEGDKLPKRTLPNVSKVAVLGDPQVLWPFCGGGTSLIEPGCTEGKMHEEPQGQEVGPFVSSVPEDGQHIRPLRQTRLPPLPVPKVKQKLNTSETDSSGGMPLMSRDIWGSGACSENSKQKPLAQFAQWANTLGENCGLKSTSKRHSGSSLLVQMSSKNAQGGDGTPGVAASENPNSKSAYPVKEHSCQEALKSPKESQGHSPRLEQVRDIGSCLDISPTTRKNSALPNVQTEPNRQPSQNKEIFLKKTSLWLRPGTGALVPQLSGNSQSASIRAQLNQKPLQNLRTSGEKLSFWLRTKSSSMVSSVPVGLHTASAATELNRHPLRNQEVSLENLSFRSKPKTSALGSQVLEGSHPADPRSELNQLPLHTQKASGEKMSFWSRPKSSALGSQASEASHRVPQKSGLELATTPSVCYRSTLPNVPVDISNSKTATLASMPAIPVWKRRPNFMKRSASCLEASQSCALKPCNTDEARVSKSPRKGDAQDEAKDTMKMRKCDAQCKTANASVQTSVRETKAVDTSAQTSVHEAKAEDTSAQTSVHEAKAGDTAAQTSFVCLLGRHVKLGDTGKHQLRTTFHRKREELFFKDLELRPAKDDTPFSFATYVSTSTVDIGRMRLAANQEKPTAANDYFDMVLFPQDLNVKVTTMGQGWLLLEKGSSFFIRRGVPFALKNLGSTAAEILYILSFPS